MGTVSPVVAKLAVERLRQIKRTGAAIGQVYAWGMVGSILGTFLTGFFLIDVLGTKGVILLLGGRAGVRRDRRWARSGTPPGRASRWASASSRSCPALLEARRSLAARDLGHPRGERRRPGDRPEGRHRLGRREQLLLHQGHQRARPDGQKRTLVLDNLIHGYFILGHPERLDYDYEHIYALVATASRRPRPGPRSRRRPRTGRRCRPCSSAAAPTPSRATCSTRTRGPTADVAEIDPAVTKANHRAPWAAPRHPIKTTWGDARQFVERNQDRKKYDLVFGDAFNDFSVPWHLTTREFNDKIARC